MCENISEINLKPGDIIITDNDDHVLILDIYDDQIFFGLEECGMIMQYNKSDFVKGVCGFIDIASELSSLKNKLHNIIHK